MLAPCWAQLSHTSQLGQLSRIVFQPRVFTLINPLLQRNLVIDTPMLVWYLKTSRADEFSFCIFYEAQTKYPSTLQFHPL